MSRIARLVLFFVAQVLILSIARPVQAQPGGIPAYFFDEWRITKSCAETGVLSDDHGEAGLRLRIDRAAVMATERRFALRPADAAGKRWRGGWRSLQLVYRPGIPMTSVPADFECIPGQEDSSPLLAMKGFSQTSEPQYEYEHWYGLVRLGRELHHVLIFPRRTKGDVSSVIILLLDADASDGISLDHNGTIHGEQFFP